MEMFSGQYDDYRLFKVGVRPWVAEWDAEEATYSATQVVICRITIHTDSIIYECMASGGRFEYYAEDLFPTKKEALEWGRTKLLYALDTALSNAQVILDAVKEKINSVKEKEVMP